MKRQPPSAGPSRESWIATIARSWRRLVELEVDFAEVVGRELAEDIHCLMVLSDF